MLGIAAFTLGVFLYLHLNKWKKSSLILICSAVFLYASHGGVGQEKIINFRKIQSILSGIERHPNQKNELKNLFWPIRSKRENKLIQDASYYSLALNKAEKSNYKTAKAILSKISKYSPFQIYRLYYYPKWTLEGKPLLNDLLTSRDNLIELLQIPRKTPFTLAAKELLPKIEISLAEALIAKGQHENAIEIYEDLFNRFSYEEIINQKKEFIQFLGLLEKVSRTEMITAWFKQLILKYPANSKKTYSELFQDYIPLLKTTQALDGVDLEEVKTAEKEWELPISIKSSSDIKKWKQWMSKNPDRKSEILWKIADYYEEIGKYKESTSWLEKIIDLGDSNKKEQALFSLAWLSYKLKNYDKSLKSFDALTREFKNGVYFTRASYWLAKILMRKNPRESEKNISRNIFKKIIKEYPLSYYAIQSSFALGVDLGTLVGGEIPEVQYRDPNLLPNQLQALERIEALFSIKQERLALDDLTYLKDSFQENYQELSHHFLIYLSLLGHQIDQHLLVFQLLWKEVNDKDLARTVGTLELLYPTPFLNEIKKYSNGLDPDLIMSLIRQESAFYPEATSSAGAKGLMQLMPFTANQIKPGSLTKIENPSTNIEIGISYLKTLLEKYEGNLVLSLAAYNAGPHRVANWLDRYNIENQEEFIESIPFRETRNYVQLILRNYYWYKKIRKSENLTTFSFASKIDY